MNANTVVDQILAAMVSALTTAGVATGGIYRSRILAVTQEETPAISIAPKTEETATFAAKVDESKLEVEVEIFVRGDPYDAIADPVALKAHKILTTDPGILSLLQKIRRKSRVWEADEADETAGSLITTYEVVYLSSSTDLSMLM